MDNSQGPMSRAPVSSVPQPSMPASTVAVTNTTGVACMVYILGGTLTVVSVGGVATGIAAAAPANNTLNVLVAPGQSIAITYSVAPTWVWIGT